MDDIPKDGEGESDNATKPFRSCYAFTSRIPVMRKVFVSSTSANLLGRIATETGGKYFPVQDASSLTALFEQIRTLTTSMAQATGAEPTPDSQPVNNFKVVYGLRILCWALLGLAIGLGQGVRENTLEDLFACSLGGLIGGGVGGALFDPLSALVTFNSGLAGRALADLVVGACIGGSMRLTQEKIVEASGKSTTVLFSALPTRRGEPPPAPAAPKSGQSNRPPLASFEVGVDREEAMRRAYKAGYGLREIAKHFGVAALAVKRAVSGG